MRRWIVRNDYLEIEEMPFYWRLTSDAVSPPDGIPARMPIRIRCVDELDMLEYVPTSVEAQALDAAYRQDANIGFLNPESGQHTTYGTSVNRFFLEAVSAFQPERIFEIGCGAGFSIKFLEEHGWSVVGIDPSEYSRLWSERLDFQLLNTYFSDVGLTHSADFIYCNDVFEHVPNVASFAAEVCRALTPGGVFCFSTTNSSRSIELGDISMLEHQHVNMFTDRSIRLILKHAGFNHVDIRGGSYGNTFQVVAVKSGETTGDDTLNSPVCTGYFSRANKVLKSFESFYTKMEGKCQYYVPLRCIPYLASVGDFNKCSIFDSNLSWRNKYLDGYNQPINAIDDIPDPEGKCFFVGSLTFFDDIRTTLLAKGYSDANIYSIPRIITGAK